MVSTPKNTLPSPQEPILPLRERIFDLPWERKLLAWYRKIFSIQEIEESKPLQWFMGAMILFFYVTFHKWIEGEIVTRHAYESNAYTCWPYFQDCGSWYFLNLPPYGYSQTILYMAFLGLMLLSAYCIWKKDWVLAHLTLLPLWVWKFLVVFILSGIYGSLDYYDILLGFVLFFLPHKLFFLQLTFVLFYFLASTIKIHPSWITGTYFSSLEGGIAFFNGLWTPVVTNLVIFSQIVLSWFLLLQKGVWQRLSVFWFTLFHLYSGTIIYYRFPSVALPTLLILFGPLYEKRNIPWDKKSVAGWLFVGFLFACQFIAILIPGDQKLTLEGNNMGLFMFEANHQCISSVEIFYTDKEAKSQEKESRFARKRCDPYQEWFTIKQVCKRNPGNIERIAWQFDHSIDGEPFYRIVDSENACNLEYKMFTHNSWIKTPEEGASVVGYPVKNFYR